MITIILNGKKAGIDTVRDAISVFRKEVEDVQVRVTYEYGDIERFMREAIRNKSDRIIIGGGDGSVNEMVDALAKVPREIRPKLAILPLGTANDFATTCGIPLESLEALRFAASGRPVSIDIAKANERHFVNIATAGFGAEITAQTPIELKNFLGGGAYTLMGILKAINFVPYKGRMKTPHFEGEQTGVIAAVCNGRAAGGGQMLAPQAMINDGLLNVMIVKKIPLLGDFQKLIEEIQSLSIDGEYIHAFATPWVESSSDEIIPVNLDGEPYSSKDIRFEIVINALDLVLPDDCPCILR